MKKAFITFISLAVAVGALYYLSCQMSDADLSDFRKYENDLSQDGGVVRDYVFSSTGELESACVYEWDAERECFGRLIVQKK